MPIKNESRVKYTHKGEVWTNPYEFVYPKDEEYKRLIVFLRRTPKRWIDADGNQYNKYGWGIGCAARKHLKLDTVTELGKEA